MVLKSTEPAYAGLDSWIVAGLDEGEWEFTHHLPQCKCPDCLIGYSSGFGQLLPDTGVRRRMAGPSYAGRTRDLIMEVAALGPFTTLGLCAQTGMSRSGHTRDTLRALIDAGIIERNHSYVYRLVPTPSAELEDDEPEDMEEESADVDYEELS